MKRKVIKLLVCVTIMLLSLSACKKEEKAENESVPMQEEILQETPTDEIEDTFEPEDTFEEEVLVEEVIKEPVLSIAELKELANEISQQYGVEIRIADDCVLEYAGYNGLLYETNAPTRCFCRHKKCSRRLSDY